MGYNTTSLNIIQANPIWGTGPGSYGTEYMRYKPTDAGEVQLAHNNFLQMGAEYGLFALFCLIAIYGFSFSALWRTRRSLSSFQYGLGYALVVSCVHSVVDFDLYVPSLGWTTFLLFSLVPTNGSQHFFKSKKPVRFIIRYGGVIVLILFLLVVAKVARGAVLADLGEKYQENQQYEKSVVAYQESLKQFPYQESVYIQLARIYMRLGAFDAAEKVMFAAVKVSPKNAMTWLFYAELMMQHDQVRGRIRSEEVLTALSKASSFYPTNMEIKNLLSICQQTAANRSHTN
jgi:tetratricopeptide (TPR) repeat protein